MEAPGQDSCTLKVQAEETISMSSLLEEESEHGGANIGEDKLLTESMRSLRSLMNSVEAEGDIESGSPFLDGCCELDQELLFSCDGILSPCAYDDDNEGVDPLGTSELSHDNPTWIRAISFEEVGFSHEEEFPSHSHEHSPSLPSPEGTSISSPVISGSSKETTIQDALEHEFYMCPPEAAAFDKKRRLGRENSQQRTRIDEERWRSKVAHYDGSKKRSLDSNQRKWPQHLHSLLKGSLRRKSLNMPTSKHNGYDQSSPNKTLKRQDSSDKCCATTTSQKRASRNLVSERNRRQNLNERLYSLRALVPNISKMDKASIVGDAINYVRDLQTQMKDIEEDIAHLNTTKEAIFNGLLDPIRDSKKLCHTLEIHGPKTPRQRHQVMEFNIGKMEEKLYQLQINCKKTPDVLLHLAQALEALEFKIISANHTSTNDHIYNTLLIEVQSNNFGRIEDVQERTIKVISKFGFLMSYS